MYLFLLKKALPFTLTFVFGAALSGLLGLFGHSEKKTVSCSFTRTYEFGSHCRMRRHNLVAESKPLVITFKPDAILPVGSGAMVWNVKSVRANVTFGADGRVREVTPGELVFRGNARIAGAEPTFSEDIRSKAVWNAVERAARLIQFEPVTVDGVPVTVTSEVEIPVVFN
ncbi:MAG: hypothetical protein ACJ754_12620 [Pyrinomonadaceae bacterium]